MTRFNTFCDVIEQSATRGKLAVRPENQLPPIIFKFQRAVNRLIAEIRERKRKAEQAERDQRKEEERAGKVTSDATNGIMARVFRSPPKRPTVRVRNSLLSTINLQSV